MLRTLNDNPALYEELERKGAKLEAGLRTALESNGIPGVINRIGSMMTLFFTEEKEVKSFDQAMKSDAPRYARFFRQSLEAGIYLGPSQYECFFVCDAHTDADLDYMLEAANKAMKSL
jgi:glutamate-1-semialdehyde 2,1-aminomutase